MTISENNGEILFGYRLADGPAERSYGVQVARLAGLPKVVIHRACHILKRLEGNQALEKFDPISASRIDSNQSHLGQMNLFRENSGKSLNGKNLKREHLEKKALNLVDSIRCLELQKITPLEALNRLNQWKKELS